MEYILVAYIYAGILSKGDSVTLTKIDTFQTIEECQQAGISMKSLVSGSVKEFRFVCLSKSK